ncbi:MAG: pentapeptide repeat-containing protein [Velocimicrobium sp.]
MDDEKKLEIYELLKECSINKDATRWNQFRRKNRKEVIDLSHFELSGFTFEQFNFKGIHMLHTNVAFSKFILCMFDQADLTGVEGFGTTFEQCNLVSLKLEEGNFSKATFQNCDLRFANLTGCQLHQSNIEQCKLDHSILTHASINDTSLLKSTFSHSSLNDCEFVNTDLHSADFTASIVNGGTILWSCYYDKMTNFTGVGLSNCRIEPILLSSFQCNIRRIWWFKWYNEHKQISTSLLHNFTKHPFKHFPDLFKSIGSKIMSAIVQFFWWITDYGSSTIRLLLVFMLTTLSFASLYFAFPQLTNDAILNQSANHLLVFIRSLYFAVVVMTGLGFGEISASSQILWGHIVIMMQSLMGYILLGAFLVRIGILFQGEFPVSSSRHRPHKTDENT